MKTKQLLWLVLAIFLGFAGLIAGCGEQPDLPTTVNSNPDDFGANDTTFVRVGPDWDAAHGYDWSNPEDIQIGRDGVIYVIDHNTVGSHSNGRVVQMEADGSILRRNLFVDITDTSSSPMGIGQDSKLNLFMVNGTNTVYYWNQYQDLIGIEEVQTEALLYDTLTQQDTTIQLDRPLYEIPEFQDERYVIMDIFGTSDPDTIASVSGEQVFYVDDYEDENILFVAQFTDVDGGPDFSGRVYLTDEEDDRIIILQVLPNRLIQLNNGEYTFTYTGVFETRAIGSGQGQGSTNQPTSIVSSGSGSGTTLYFTQKAGNFLTQRIKGSGTNWFFDIVPTGGGNPEVLELEYFGSPMAIALGEDDSRGLGLFYVADSLQNRLIAFHPSGFRFRDVAADKVYMDLEGGERLVDVIADEGLVFNEDMNPGLADFIAARVFEVSVDSAQSLSAVLAGLELEFDAELNPDIPADTVAADDSMFELFFAADSTVEVLFPILDGPKGVATREGVVYVADSGNNRILRFLRSDSNTYLPEDPDS